MEQDTSDNILAFDTLFTTNHMQILKSLLPYVDSDFQKKLAVYIKFSELQYTLSYFQNHKAEISGCSLTKKEFDLSSIYQTIKGYCTHEEQSQIEQLINFMNTMEMVKNMREMMEFMNELETFSNFTYTSSDTSPSDNSSEAVTSDSNPETQMDSFSMLTMLKGMLPPEQAELFEMIQKGGI